VRAAPLVITALALGVMAPAALAHEVRPAYLELNQTGEQTYDVLWKVPARGDMRLAVYVRFPPDTQQLTPPAAEFVGDAHVERWSVRHPDGLVGSEVMIDGLRRTRIDVLARVSRLDGTTQTVRVLPSDPSFVVDASPSGWRVVRVYFSLGVEHILLGVDHLLFVLGLLLLVDRAWVLAKTITAFTVAHSLTLALSTFAVIRVPEDPLNACIALSILFLGPEAVRKRRGQTSLTIRHPWSVAFAFGLLHGVGFASGLSVAGLPRAEIPSALLWFNVGVEAGQLAFVAVALAVGWAVRVLALDRPGWVRRLPEYSVGSLGAFWTIQRVVIMWGG